MRGSAELRLHVNLWLDPDVHAAPAARTWFEQAWARLGGVLRERVSAHPLPVDDIRRQVNAGRIYETLPPVGSPYCYLTNYGGDYGDEVVAAHTMNSRSWSWFLAELEQGGGETAHLAGGFMEEGSHVPGNRWLGWPGLQVRVETDGAIIAQVRLGLSAHPQFLAATAEQEQALCAFLHEAAAATDPTYGEISL